MTHRTAENLIFLCTCTIGGEIPDQKRVAAMDLHALYLMSAEQIKKPLITIPERHFDLFKVQRFFGKSRKTLALIEQTLCSISSHSNGCDRQNQ